MELEGWQVLIRIRGEIFGTVSKCFEECDGGLFLQAYVVA